MKIKRININKFRKLENINENNIGLINELYGSNGSGKTSFISFVTWMIYGETLDYGKNDDLNIDTFKPYELISGEIQLDNGNTFGRSFGYDEKGKKTQDFFVNGRKVKKQDEYYNKIYECFGLETLVNLKIKNFNLLKALSDPYYLPNNETQFRDLINFILNCNISEILFENNKYEDIKEDYYMQGGDYDNCKDFYNQRLKALEKELLVLNSIISEGNEINFNEEEFVSLQQELIKLSQTKVNDKEELKEIIDKLYEIEHKLVESRKNDLTKPHLTKEQQEYSELKNKYNVLYDEYDLCYKDNHLNKTKKETIEKQLTLLRNELYKVKESKFENKYCPNCDYILNEEDYKVFNKNKVEETKRLKATIENLEKQLQEIEFKDLKAMEEQLQSYLDRINALKSIIETQPTKYISEETKRLENEYNSLYEEYKKVKEQNDIEKNNIIQDLKNKHEEIECKLQIMESNRIKLINIEKAKVEKQNVLNVKGKFELKLSLLNEFKLDEISIIKSKTQQIFGNDFEFEMLVKNKSNDNYKKVCYASINGLEHNKSNTAKYLKFSIMLLEKLKAYIGGCDLPIIFDIVDNIGESTRNDIFALIKNSQIFYTRISDKDNVQRKLNVIKGE